MAKTEQHCTNARHRTVQDLFVESWQTCRRRHALNLLAMAGNKAAISAGFLSPLPFRGSIIHLTLPLATVNFVLFCSIASSGEMARETAPPVARTVYARPDAVMLEEVAQFLRMHSTFKEVSAFPAIEFLDEKSMSALHSGNNSPSVNSNILSLYDRSSRTVYLPLGWQGRSPVELSILVHEMVHFLQDQAGRRFACLQEMEEEALGVQERWLLAHGSSLEKAFGIDPFTRLTASLCYY